MSERLAAAAEKMGVPAPLVERAARAWAAASGQSYDDVLAAWAGGAAVAAAPPPEPEPTEETAPEPSPEPADTPAPPPAAEAPRPAAAVAAAPAPERVSPEDALDYPVVVTVPTAGISERIAAAVPTWLGALLLVIPAFGLLYLALAANAECGDATVLRVDRLTGAIVNCDGSEFEGRGTPGNGVDFIAMGQTVYASCAGCHGAQGQGQGNFPPLTGVIETFGSCPDMIEWVTLGSAGFVAAGRTTYGDPNKTVAGGMPGFGTSLTEEQVAAVVAYERVRHAGGNTQEVLVDCGLVEPAEGEPAEGEPAEGAAEPAEGMEG